MCFKWFTFIILAWQRDAIAKTRPVVEENIRDMLLKLNFPKCIKVTDLGCSSGQNTFLVMFEIVNTITGSYQQTNQNLPEIDYCLNDLPENDFNTTFKLVPSFNKEVKGKCYISGVPGSFYSRLFPRKSLHFLHSSYSLMWLSKVPQGLEDNKNNVYIRSGCSLSVCQSYTNQFQNDFYLFLRMRSEEMLPDGRMVLTFIGKKDVDPLCRDGFYLWSLLSDAFIDLVSEVIIYCIYNWINVYYVVNIMFLSTACIKFEYGWWLSNTILIQISMLQYFFCFVSCVSYNIQYILSCYGWRFLFNQDWFGFGSSILFSL